MLLRHLTLQHFRNYQQLDVRFEPGLVILQGDNAQGKTNLLEAIYLLATTKSVRARTDADLVSWAEQDPLTTQRFARIVGHVERDSGTLALEILVREVGEGQARKRFKLNGVERRASDMLGKVNAVFFSPSDVDLVAGSPSVRRRYLDVMLCQVDSTYVRALGRFNRALLQRNALLRQVRDGTQRQESLEYWDAQMCDFGAQIIGARARAVREIASEAASRHAALSGDEERFQVQYKAALPEDDLPADLAEAGPSSALIALKHALARMRPREIAAGMSLAGPQRDDLGLTINGADVVYFGSRGQQRTAALALRLAELTFMRGHTHEQPILLLDDATSELDERRRDAILHLAGESKQTFMSGADSHAFGNVARASQRWHVQGGVLTRAG